MRIIKITLLLSILISCNQTPKKTQETLIEKPNVLFIAIDDLNDWVETLSGNPQTITPNLKSFANQSVNFRNNYCTSPGCNPSRSTMLTGLHTYNSGMYSNYQDWRKVPGLQDKPTLPRYFRDNGYFTAGAGKIFHYSQIDSLAWDSYYPAINNPMPADIFPDDAPAGMEPFKYMYNMFDWSPLDIPNEETGDYKSVDYISNLLKQDHEKPFFLACGIYRPHLPWYVPKEYFDKFPIDEVLLPEVLENDSDDLGGRAKELISRGGNYHKHVIENDVWREGVQGYLASVSYADAMLGILLNNLQNSAYADNTIIVLWSDHGWQLGEKQHWRKFALWDNVIKTIQMIHVPAGIKSLAEGSADGTDYDEMSSLLDIFPTLVEACNLPALDYLDGQSLLPILAAPDTMIQRPIITTYDFGDYSVRYGKWHYIKYVDDSEELYNLNEDEHEWHNLAEIVEYKAIKQMMASHLPTDAEPLAESSLINLMEHHIPPVKSKEYYYSKERRQWLKRFEAK